MPLREKRPERETKRHIIPESLKQRLRCLRLRFAHARQTVLARAGIWLHRRRTQFAGTYHAWLLGQWFYQVGFGAEYMVVQAARILATVAGVVWHGVRWAAIRLAKTLLAWLLDIWQDLTGPITGVFRGLRGLRHTAKAGYAGDGAPAAAKNSAAYVSRGLVQYGRLVSRMASYLLPVAGVVLFAVTVGDKLDQNYALAVECNGQVVGYVEDELVFDEARDKVRSRIVLVQDQDWNVEPTFTLASADTVMDVNETADAILMASSDEIQEAVGLELDGQLVAITDGGDELRQYLDSRKAEYEQPDNPNLRVEFLQDVQVVDGLYASETVRGVQDVIAMLSGVREQQQDYAIQAGDSLTLVASRFDLTSAQLTELNPKLADPSYNWPIGDTLVVHQEVPYLQVKTIETQTVEEVVPFTKQVNRTNELNYGKTRVVQTGADGADQVTYEYVRVNGILTQVTEVERVRLYDPVTEITEEGTRLPDGGVGMLGTGTWTWPVPGYTYVSQWMGGRHKGTDICAPRGTAIVAADSGVVIKSGWNGAGSGYGYSIVIQHGSGRTSLYGHCDSLNVYVGQSVEKGQVIATVGNTGYSFGNHLHFEMTQSGYRRDIREFFDRSTIRYNPA